jgi:Ca2+-binding EF-hand superfamily protein
MLLSGTPPFRGRRDREVLAAVRRGKFSLAGPRWEGVSDSAKDFIRRLLVFNPTKRASAAEALAHPWLAAARAASRAPALGDGVPPLSREMLASLRAFASLPPLPRAALEAAVLSLPADQLDGLRRVFDALDPGGQGAVSAPSFCAAAVAAGVGAGEAAALFRDVHPAGGGPAEPLA